MIKKTGVESNENGGNTPPFYPINYIDKEFISKQMRHFQSMGITTTNRTPRLIVSLTSFPERMYDIHFCLYSLLNQTFQPDEIVLWLAEEEFPDKEKDVPPDVLRLLQKGLTIKWCENVRSYIKLIPSLRDYPNDIIVTADDDIYYPENWLELLYKSYLKEPAYIHCHRAHRVKFSQDGCVDKYNNWEKEILDNIPSLLNFSTGVGGVLYPPKSLYQDASNHHLFMDLCPTADDVWFWVMAVLQGSKVKIVENNVSKLTYINPERELGLNQEQTLAKLNILQNKNDEQINNVFNYYKELKQKLALIPENIGREDIIPGETPVQVPMVVWNSLKRIFIKLLRKIIYRDSY
jgi:hypothetical protein